MSSAGDKPQPRRSAKGEKKAAEKFARQAAALRANLKRRHAQRRAQDDDAKPAREADRD